MDDNNIIYSSIFLLVSFIFTYKFLKCSAVISIFVPCCIICLYFVCIMLNLFDNSNMDIITELPDF